MYSGSVSCIIRVYSTVLIHPSEETTWFWGLLTWQMPTSAVLDILLSCPPYDTIRNMGFPYSFSYRSALLMKNFAPFMVLFTSYHHVGTTRMIVLVEPLLLRTYVRPDNLRFNQARLANRFLLLSLSYSTQYHPPPCLQLL